MIERKKHISYNNRGSAIITALVASTVVMVLCLSLLAVAYSLFLSQKANTSDMSDREMLYSAVEMFEKQLSSGESDPVVVLAGSGELTTPVSEDTGVGKYILDSIWKGFQQEDDGYYYQKESAGEDIWYYYTPPADPKNPQNIHEKISKCSKYFIVNYKDDDGKPSSYSLGALQVEVQLYWMLPEALNSKWDGIETSKEGTVLHAIYRLYNKKDHELKVKTERTYRLKGKTVYLQSTSGEGTTPSGKYKVVFKNKQNPKLDVEPSDFYLPDDMYFDSLDEVPDIVEKVKVNDPEDRWYSWYKNKNCESGSMYEKTDNPFTEADFAADSSGQLTATLYTNWGNKIPRRVRFIMYGYCVKSLDVKYCSKISLDEVSLFGDGNIWQFRTNNGTDLKSFFETGGFSSEIKYDTDVFVVNDYVDGIIKKEDILGLYHPEEIIDINAPNVSQAISFFWERITG